MTRNRNENRKRHAPRLAFATAVLASLGTVTTPGCTREQDPARPAPERAPAPAPTNRVDIPESVRRNLGITFARVEPRTVERTLRVPGRFELVPAARREYRSPVEGTVEVLIAQHQRVEAGTPLFRVTSPELVQLRDDTAAARARVDAYEPLKRAHEGHRESLGAQAKLWADRVAQLERIRDAGGGGASQIAAARAELGNVQIALAGVAAEETELESTRRVDESALRSLESRRSLLLAGTGCGEAAQSVAGALVVCASAPGQVDQVPASQGGRIDRSALVASVIDPSQVRFRAKALQSDLGRLHDGMRGRIAMGSATAASDTAIAGPLTIAPVADADARTIELLVVPEGLQPWARAGITGTLEVPLAGASDELAIPLSAVVRDGAVPIVFRRDPANPDRAIRLEADLGTNDGQWVAILSGVREGDEVVVAGSHQLMLATSGTAAKGGHFHPDGTFHEGED
jgi:hypothetical protein